MEPDSSAKQNSLESLRGIASLVVVFGHYIGAFYPVVVWGQVGHVVQHSSCDKLFACSPLAVLVAGDSAMHMFFVLSGFVLSYKLVGQLLDRRVVAIALVKRPFRLGGLVVVTAVIGAILWAQNLLWNADISKLTMSEVWFGHFWSGQFHFANFLKHMLLPFTTSAKYNPPLWAIWYELYGSVLLLAFLFIFGSFKYRIFLFSALALSMLVFEGGVYLLVVSLLVGSILADIKRNYSDYVWKIKNGYMLCLVLLISLYLASIPSHVNLAFLEGTIYGWVPFQGVRTCCRVIGVWMLFSLVVTQPRIASYLNNGLLVQLGHLSYATYAVHFLVLGSFSSWLFLCLFGRLGYGTTFLVVFVTSLGLIIAIAVVLTRCVDDYSIKVSSIVSRMIVTRSMRACRVVTTRASQFLSKADPT